MALVLTYWVTAGNTRDHLSDPKEGKHNWLECISLCKKKKITVTQVIKNR